MLTFWFAVFSHIPIFCKKSPIWLNSLSSEHFRKELFIILIKWKEKWSSLDFVIQSINSREMPWTRLFARRLVPSPVWTLLGTAWWLLPFYKKMWEVTNGIIVICHGNFTEYFTEMKASRCVSPDLYSVIKFHRRVCCRRLSRTSSGGCQTGHRTYGRPVPFWTSIWMPCRVSWGI